MIYIDETEPEEGETETPFEPRKIFVKKGKDIKEEYTLLEELGRGKFGTVYKCSEKETGRILAAKFITTTRADDRKDVEREVDIMRILQHPRLLQLYDAYDDEKKQMCLVLELIEGGELFERVIDDDFVLTEKACSIFMKQICEGVDYMHSQNILHLDMKPENVLCVSKTGNRIKLIDFGFARKYEPNKKMQVLFGTPEFVAPEVVNFERISYGTDMWSVGVICYVLLSGLSPFMGDSDLETMANVTKAAYDFDDESFDQISDEAKDFIAKLLLKERP
ncbi:myosin light chain kinase, smooth muscle-like, partial [Limulus polyphemus]|uniref:Myosin light chain kinase, smooth muscle-like n=1 Tax=Limulus polyphemus TaxID=6850 RepID=A0ABM1TPR4_LIMPO